MSKKIYETSEYMYQKKGLESVLLFAASEKKADALEALEHSLDELELLAESAGAKVQGRIVQVLADFSPNRYLGKGKLAEIKDIAQAQSIELLICDDALSPSALKYIEDETGVPVIDRTLLILDIFAQRASSYEGKLQVELAQLIYRLPRLQALNKGLSRQGGGIGTRGPGETALEMNRRHLQKRIDTLKSRLKDLDRTRQNQRKLRKKSDTLVLAVVGYTNAGKSSLINKLCKSNLYAEDQFFATLDASVKKLYFPEIGERLLIVDTVGFIRKLPPVLIEAFSSTLDEILEADLVLHLVDVSDPEAVAHSQNTIEVLTSLQAIEIPRLTVLNKIDLVESGQIDKVLLSEVSDDKTSLFSISVKTGQGLDVLKNHLQTKILEIKNQNYDFTKNKIENLREEQKNFVQLKQ